MTRDRPHCVVIGAGIIGSCCAWHLRRRGARVTLVDSELPGQSTSFGNAGCISKTSVFPFSHPGVTRKVPGWLLDADGPVRLRWSQLPQVAPWLFRFWRAGSAARVAGIVSAQAALMEHVVSDFDEILDATGNGHLREARGAILLYETERDFAADAWEFRERERLGLTWRRLTAEELEVMEPRVRLGPGGIALFEPLWQHVTDPGGLTARLAEAAIAQGSEWVRDRVRNIGAAPSGIRLETVSGRTLDADRLVLASGVWSNQLLAPLGFRVPLIAKRGYHAMIAEPGYMPRQPIMSVSHHVLLTPMVGGLRVSGTAEFAALDAPPDYARARSLLAKARRFVPDLPATGNSEWMGQRPMMSDSLPVLGPLPGMTRVSCAFGHGHYGLTQGPTTGKLVARLVFGDDPGIDMTPFSIARFQTR